MGLSEVGHITPQRAMEETLERIADAVKRRDLAGDELLEKFAAVEDVGLREQVVWLFQQYVDASTEATAGHEAVGVAIREAMKSREGPDPKEAA